MSETFQSLFSRLKKERVLSEKVVGEAMQEVRLALLKADVAYSVVDPFLERVKKHAVGVNLVRGVEPGKQLIQIVHQEMVALMGGEEVPLDLKGKLSILLLVGLQGSGKTTTCAKIAAYIQKKEPHRKILLAACDRQRAAAVEQLVQLGQKIGVEVFSLPGSASPLEVAQGAKGKALTEGFDLLLVDTAGRTHVDEELMGELVILQQFLVPRETLFVASGAMGQDAVRGAAAFHAQIPITGTILTMLDGGARAGAALSIREVTQQPLRFEGTGEQLTDFRLFHPRSMADRILGMGDVVHLVEKAKEQWDEKQTAEMEEKMRRASFTYDDYLTQIARVRKMGSFKALMQMLPGMGGLGGVDVSDDEFCKVEAMIRSMTPRERLEKEELSVGRRRRIAQGSGVDVTEVNRMVKQMKQLKQFMKSMPTLGRQGKGSVWR